MLKLDITTYNTEKLIDKKKDITARAFKLKVETF